MVGGATYNVEDAKPWDPILPCEIYDRSQGTYGTFETVASLSRPRMYTSSMDAAETLLMFSCSVDRQGGFSNSPIRNLVQDRADDLERARVLVLKKTLQQGLLFVESLAHRSR